ncbi:MAG: hypothetical protein AUF65_02675 [Chloroflexi bacterium 13_1_20CM_50_12]|nr:MAG: hypothetical protein AUF65_02675 [Chloroflexi bacterium 13_1_20CM_50_12]
MAKWVDPRMPVSVTQVGKWTVTIYDQAAYDESLRLYPDDPNRDKLQVVKARVLFIREEEGSSL